jgi:hypothetical protein
MKTLIRLFIVVTIFLNLSICYAQTNLENEIMDEDEIDYDSNSVQTSSPQIETHDESSYNVDMRPYVTFHYTSNKTRIERK